MKKVSPKVFLLAETQFSNFNEGVGAWLRHIGGEDCLTHVTGSDAEALIEFNGRRCYKSFTVGLNPNITKIRTNSEEYQSNLLFSGHGSVLEHASATFAFEDVSRVFTHELVRHRAGAAYSQESMRYVRLGDGMPFWIPPEISENEEACALFESILVTMEDAQKELARIFKIDELKDFASKKELTSAFRRIAPDGMATGIVATFNMRTLRHLLALRTSRYAEREMRMVFNVVGDIAIARWPMLFSDFHRELAPGDSSDCCEWIPENIKV